MYKSSSFYIYDNISTILPVLVSCWHVTCGDNYSYAKTQSMINREPQNMLCAIRTISGEGKIITNNNIYNLKPNSLIILPNKEILKYLSVSQSWDYFWYNFTCQEKLPKLNIATLYDFNINATELQNANQMLELMRIYSIAAVSLTNMIFTTQLYQWIYQLENINNSSVSYYNEVNRCVEYINTHLSENISVSRLASINGFSERHFRQLFTNIVGVAPKIYQREQRMKKAVSLLKNTSLTISSISNDLGYYSPFQFSRDFKAHYGNNPTSYRKNNK